LEIISILLSDMNFPAKVLYMPVNILASCSHQCKHYAIELYGQISVAMSCLVTVLQGLGVRPVKPDILLADSAADDLSFLPNGMADVQSRSGTGEMLIKDWI
jgi:hypothetical protein